MASFSEEPRPGDIIDIFHIGYKDWAIYVGDGNVIHLTPPRGFPRIGSSNMFIFLTGRAQVTEEPLGSAAWGCLYRVNNYLDDKCRPRPVDDIISSAREMIHSEKTYTVLSDNSKTFVTDLRYGRPRRELSREDPMPGDLMEICRGLYERTLGHLRGRRSCGPLGL
ncbi:phospholipase A and acyltransferase 4-like isoform X2 [Phyllostomus hastatus]|uniref:phospholipase A and acyltransferase 4-like isoform X2 n=1 Tax=Phyllostomus hastatus TaxID=9423 RepID=UPI001E683047|nr:phospholipase A and acyltransferase 4-like isoform X2 [Phyllostomus hastatus]XP_045711223.1 phospholipase A and acyltransferase 4-like isoform X2 [Phyllostomus hastatus]